MRKWNSKKKLTTVDFYLFLNGNKKFNVSIVAVGEGNK